MISLELQAKVWSVRMFRVQLYPSTLISVVLPSTAHTEETVAFSTLPSSMYTPGRRFLPRNSRRSWLKAPTSS